MHERARTATSKAHMGLSSLSSKKAGYIKHNNNNNNKASSHNCSIFEKEYKWYTKTFCRSILWLEYEKKMKLNKIII